MATRLMSNPHSLSSVCAVPCDRQVPAGRGVFASDAPLTHRLRWLLVLLVACGLFYGAVMGTYSGLTPSRIRQLLYSGVKVPLLLLATFALCLPSFFVINTVAGLREDFGQVLHALVATQVVVRRYYSPLIRRSPRHRQLLRFWFVLYAFVGIQMGRVLRPFIGDPDLPVAFFRSGA